MLSGFLKNTKNRLSSIAHPSQSNSTSPTHNSSQNSNQNLQNQNSPQYSQNQNPPQYSQNQTSPQYSQNQTSPQYSQNQTSPQYSQNQNSPQYSQNQNPPQYSQIQNPQNQISPQYSQNQTHHENRLLTPQLNDSRVVEFLKKGVSGLWSKGMSFSAPENTPSEEQNAVSQQVPDDFQNQNSQADSLTSSTSSGQFTASEESHGGSIRKKLLNKSRELASSAKTGISSKLGQSSVANQVISTKLSEKNENEETDQSALPFLEPDLVSMGELTRTHSEPLTQLFQECFSQDPRFVHVTGNLDPTTRHEKLRNMFQILAQDELSTRERRTGLFFGSELVSFLICLTHEKGINLLHLTKFVFHAHNTLGESYRLAKLSKGIEREFAKTVTRLGLDTSRFCIILFGGTKAEFRKHGCLSALVHSLFQEAIRDKLHVMALAFTEKQKAFLENLGFKVEDSITSPIPAWCLFWYYNNPTRKAISTLEDLKKKFETKKNDKLKLDIYELSEITFDEKIGQGAFGSVYKGTWQLSTPVALKRIESSSNSSFTEFLLEAKTLFSIRHPHIVSCFGMYYHENIAHLVTEYCSQGSLEHLLRKQRFPVEHLISIARDACSGMRHLEKSKILHRDLACRNLLVDDNYRVKVSDFGMSRSIATETYTRKSKTAVPVRWAAPEMLKLGEAMSSATDVWAFGVVLFEIFSHGDIPWGVELSNSDVKSAVLQGKVLQPYSIFPPEIGDVMKQCFAFEQDRRPTFEALLMTFHNLAQKTPVRTDSMLLSSQLSSANFHEGLLAYHGVEEDDTLLCSQCTPVNRQYDYDNEYTRNDDDE